MLRWSEQWKQRYFKSKNLWNFWSVDPKDLKLKSMLDHDLKNLSQPKILKELKRIRIFWFVKLCCTKTGSKPKIELTLIPKLQITWNLVCSFYRMSWTYSNQWSRKLLPNLWRFSVWRNIAPKSGKTKDGENMTYSSVDHGQDSFRCVPTYHSKQEHQINRGKTVGSRNHSERPKRAKNRVSSWTFHESA